MIFLKVRAISGTNENPCLILNLQTLRLEENLHFRLSAAGGTPVPSLSTVPNLKWWVICYGPKGSRKAWPNLTKPEGHKKDFEQNVSGLLTLPIPSQLLRANNFHVMAMGERRGEKSEKSFWQKTASSRWKKANEFHSVCTNTLCAWLPWVQDWPCCPWAAALCPSRLCNGDFTSHVLPCSLGGAAFHSASPQNICQQGCPTFPELGQRIFPLSTRAVLPLPQPDVLEVQTEDAQDGMMSIGWWKSNFPGKICTANFLPFLKIQVELCFPLWAVLG